MFMLIVDLNIYLLGYHLIVSCNMKDSWVRPNQEFLMQYS